MKKILFITAIALGALTSCDKVENPFPAAAEPTNWDLYPAGDSAHYYANVYSAFTANTNVDRNILIEDYTGHTCNFCPAAAAEAESLEDANPDRVYISTVHAGELGTGSLQEINLPDYPTVFFNSTTEALGNYFGSDWSGSLFGGNPYGAISRNGDENGTPMQGPTSWTSSTNALLATNDLKVNLQAVVNYYPSTRGVILHVEVDNFTGITNELRIVVQLHEDSLVAPQKMLNNTLNATYVHHDILRGTLDNKTFGLELDSAHNETGTDKYYFDYIKELPAEYVADNSHLIIYVRDAVTEEIYHVIEKHFN